MLKIRFRYIYNKGITMTHAVTKIRKRRKEKVVNIFGGKCCKCGYNKCLNALEFHHTDPTIKENAPTTIINQWNTARSVEQLKKEKVILLCANCHKEAHSIGYDYDLKRHYADIIITKCKHCETDFHQLDLVKKQTFCSDECRQIHSRKVERPTKEQLIELTEKFSFVKIGKLYGVSDNAIRKWVKYYNVDS